MKLTTSALNLMGWMMEQTAYYGEAFTSADMAVIISTPFEIKQMIANGLITPHEKVNTVPEFIARHNPHAARRFIVQGFKLTEKGAQIGEIGRHMRTEARQVDQEDIASPSDLMEIATRYHRQAQAVMQQVAA